MTLIEIKALVDDYGNAMFECGDFQYSDDGDFASAEAEYLVRAKDAARNKLEAALEALFSGDSSGKG